MSMKKDDIITCSGQVACLPFPSQKADKRVGGLAFVAQKMELTELKVFLSTKHVEQLLPRSGDYVYVRGDSFTQQLLLLSGDYIYVRGDRFTQQWAKERMSIPGLDEEFILVPLTEVVAYKRNNGA